jgi:hypothetical protein
LIAQLDPSTVITEIAPDPSGSRVTIHDPQRRSDALDNRAR